MKVRLAFALLPLLFLGSPVYANVGVAQGIAYVDFGFIEPSILVAIVKTAKNGQAAPK